MMHGESACVLRNVEKTQGNSPPLFLYMILALVFIIKMHYINKVNTKFKKILNNQIEL